MKKPINGTTMKFVSTLGLLLACAAPLVAFAETNVKQLAQSCTACHGEHGKSLNPVWPNLAGQKRDYLEKQLHDFKSGERKNPIMMPFIQTLSDKDIEALAEYYSQLN